MIEKIGTTAGEIWHLLNERGEMSISRVTSEIDAPQSIVYMGIGWLAREDKLEFTKKTRGIFIKLK
ncbi:MAG: winged helix-turn-helix domain-containing protein [Candidatus Syntropharchaeia archaeon]